MHARDCLATQCHCPSPFMPFEIQRHAELSVSSSRPPSFGSGYAKAGTQPPLLPSPLRPSCRWEEICSSAALSGYTGYLQEKQGGELATMGVALFVKKQRGLRLVWRESRTRALLGALSFLDSCGQQQVSAAEQQVAYPLQDQTGTLTRRESRVQRT